jgi:hypothetical protein
MYYCQVSNGVQVLNSDSAMLMTKKLAIHLKFDGNVTDSSAMGNNGTAVGSVAYGIGADGVTNHALQLSNTSGTSNYVRVLNPVSSLSSGIAMSSKDIIANTSSFTISCWVKPSFVQSFEMYVSTACPGNGWYLARQSTGSNAIFNTFDSSVAVVSTVDPFNDGKWHMLTAVVDSVNREDFLYLDGKLQSQGVASPNPGYDFLVGALNWAKYPSLSIDLGYTGLIDDVRYYNYALAQDDLYDLYYQVSGKAFCPTGGAGTGDLNADCKVDFADLALISEDWLNCSLYPASTCD